MGASPARRAASSPAMTSRNRSRRAMRDGAGDDVVADMLRAAVWRKEPGHLVNSPYFKQPERGMSAIGG